MGPNFCVRATLPADFKIGMRTADMGGTHRVTAAILPWLLKKGRHCVRHTTIGHTAVRKKQIAAAIFTNTVASAGGGTHDGGGSCSMLTFVEPLSDLIF